MRVWGDFQDVSDGVERYFEVGENTRFKSRWHQDVDAGRKFFLFGNRCAQVPRVRSATCANGCLAKACERVLVRSHWEGIGIRSVKAHSNAYFELFGVRNRDAAIVSDAGDG